MEEMRYPDKFDPLELEDLRTELMRAEDVDGATEMIAQFLKYNGYGVNQAAVHDLVANGMSKKPFEEFRRQLEKIALEN